MNTPVRAYLALLIALALGWLVLRLPAFGAVPASAGVVAATVLYAGSHMARMLRLALLSLDRRDRAFALASAHALTAFPSSFAPFKAGELLRLVALVRAHGNRGKAVALWLAERCGDVVVISVFILALYLFDVDVPPAMRTVLVLFLLASLAGLFALLAVAKTFVFLNRHLVLVSHSRHGLLLLRASHALRRLELHFQRCLEGRTAAFLLLSLVVWTLELAALGLFFRTAGSGGDFAATFAASLLHALPGRAAGGFGLYQSLALVLLTLIFTGAVALAAHLTSKRP
ncbi:lysylphosphatidylglycerol synthase domain-containing protein [Pseudoduganella chitinolytica]|uniref:Flippase-like domain-containing protein n=1 Tax=Pseudoduganella chitinolytica TaxID=34070 RepID=A0ABY8BAZ2_9BURK|nr:lysylphosphatidylglycerol synthase domain-containing protein [Pseudoduganella chitinolytica]WEF32950.1 hypothetical protein PX653_26745 [Pseudoduganella chitinolytica]